MNKVKLPDNRIWYHRPVFLVGVNVDGKPNVMTAAGTGFANGQPPMVSVPFRRGRYTLRGILENNNFSLNIPSVNQIKEVDYCGTASGLNIDKVTVCKFKIFNGQMSRAPMIEQCPVNLGCKVAQVISLGSHDLVIGEIVETLVSDELLTDGNLDTRKLKAIVYMQNPDQYLAFGELIGRPHEIGKKL